MNAEIDLIAEDCFLETRIGCAYEAILTARDHSEQRTAAENMAGLIKLRSPARIRQMELERFGRSFG